MDSIQKIKAKLTSYLEQSFANNIDDLVASGCTSELAIKIFNKSNPKLAKKALIISRMESELNNSKTNYNFSFRDFTTAFQDNILTFREQAAVLIYFLNRNKKIFNEINLNNEIPVHFIVENQAWIMDYYKDPSLKIELYNEMVNTYQKLDKYFTEKGEILPVAPENCELTDFTCLPVQGLTKELIEIIFFFCQKKYKAMAAPDTNNKMKEPKDSSDTYLFHQKLNAYFDVEYNPLRYILEADFENIYNLLQIIGISEKKIAQIFTKVKINNSKIELEIQSEKLESLKNDVFTTQQIILYEQAKEIIKDPNFYENIRIKITEILVAIDELLQELLNDLENKEYYLELFAVGFQDLLYFLNIYVPEFSKKRMLTN